MELATTDIILDLDEVAGRVSLVLRLCRGYFLRDCLAGWGDTVQSEDVEADIPFAVFRVLIHLLLDHLNQVDGVTEAEVMRADRREFDREGDDRMDRVDVADATGLLVLGEGHVVAVVGVDLKLVARDGGGVLAPVDLGLVLRFVLVFRMEDDWSIVLAEVDGIFAALDDRHERLLVDGDEDGVGSGAYVVRIRHGVGVEHAVLVIDVCQLVRFSLAEEGGRSVEDSAVLELQSFRVCEMGGTDVLCDVILHRHCKGYNIRFADGWQIRHVQHWGLLEGHVDGRVLEAGGAGVGLPYRVFQFLGEVIQNDRVGHDRIVDRITLRGEPL